MLIFSELDAESSELQELISGPTPAEVTVQCAQLHPLADCGNVFNVTCR